MSVSLWRTAGGGNAPAGRRRGFGGIRSITARKIPLAAATEPLRDLMDDRPLQRSRDDADRLRLTGEGSMLGELVKAVLERPLAPS
jgi:hypothetical protein